MDPVATVIANTSVELTDLEMVLRKLLQTVSDQPVGTGHGCWGDPSGNADGIGDVIASFGVLEPTPPTRPTPGGMESMLKRLLSLTPAPVPTSTPLSAFLVREAGQRCPLLLGMLTSIPRLSPILTRKDWTTMVCFSCGRWGHGVSRCLQLHETFPYLSPGWSVERRDGQCMAVLQGTIT